MLNWNHYKFQQNLIQAVEKHGFRVGLLNESYTSKTCPHSGQIHENLGGHKKFQYPEYGFTLPRDWNGAGNIMIRALSATTLLVFSWCYTDSILPVGRFE
jgi:putative transposase